MWGAHFDKLKQISSDISLIVHLKHSGTISLFLLLHVRGSLTEWLIGGRYGSGGKSCRLAVGGLPVRSHPGHVEVSLSKTSNPQLLLMSWLVPCMAANRRWCVNVCVKGINCTALWIKALYKCSPFTMFGYMQYAINHLVNWLTLADKQQHDGIGFRRYHISDITFTCTVTFVCYPHFHSMSMWKNF